MGGDAERGAADMREQSGREGWPARAVAVAEVLLLLLFLLPLLLLPGEERPVEPSPSAEVEESGGEIRPTEGWDEERTIRLLRSGGEVEEMTMADYLWAVVAAEMPASFYLEALKAQAVCARTYCLYQSSGGDKHPGADVCDDYTCCQAYLTREQAMANWGEEGERYADKIAQAVADTDGLLCLYEGAPIDAVFFSSAAGRTKDAQAVWGTAVPYLTAVDSPEGEEVPGWRTMVTFTPEEFAARLTQTHPEADLSGPPETWLGQLETDETGTVTSLTLGGVPLTGGEARTLFGLRSSNFTLELTEEKAVFWVTGYGHGVGMSQYGANALAGEGKTFDQILKWYYTGIQVGSLG